MSTLINNDKQLETLILNELRKAFANIADNIFNRLWKNISKDIYDKPSSKYYDRTNEFFNSLIKPNVKVSNGVVTVTVGMDYTKMSPKSGDAGKFNAHQGFKNVDSWRGMPVSEALLSWWDYGTDNQYASLPRTDYWYDVFGDRGYNDNPTYKNLEKIIDEEIVKILSKFGDVKKNIKITIS